MKRILIGCICMIFFGLNVVLGQLVLEKFSEEVNTHFDEIGPVFSEDGQTMFFTRVASPDFIKAVDLQDDKVLSIYNKMEGKVISNISKSTFNQDIWVAKLKSPTEVQEVLHPGLPINNVFPNSVCAVMPTNKSVIVINQFDDAGHVFEGFSQATWDGKELFGKPLAIDINNLKEEGSNVSLSMSQDAQHIFISMERKDSEGRNDIYVSVKIDEAMWSYPRPLNINTIYNETSPFISADKKTLMFSSNRPNGMGKQDLYVSKRLDYTYQNWSEPTLLPVPINSDSDDFLGCISPNKQYVYFTSNRTGNSDIYYVDMFRDAILPKPLKLMTEIRHGVTGELLRAEMVWKKFDAKESDGFIRTYLGKHTLVISESYPIQFIFEKRGFEKVVLEFDPWEIFMKDSTEKTILVEMFPKTGMDERGVLLDRPKNKLAQKDGFVVVEPPIYPVFGKDRKIVLEHIMFVVGKAEVIENSTKSIDELAQILKEYPSMEILIIGHTDNIGDKKLLKALSEERAKVIKQMLLNAGVDASRMYTIGKGDTDPISANDSEEMRRKNRRVEIKIIKD